MRWNLPQDIVKRWELLPIVCHGKEKMRSAATESRNSSSKPGTSAWEDAALVLLWLKEAQPHILGHPGAFTGVPQPGVSGCPGAAWPWGVWGAGGRDVLVDGLGCFA